MNTRTKDAMMDFINAVESLTASCVRDIGQDEAGQIIEKCESLKTALDRDETITEVR